MKVSVLIITYNHESFISKAVESALIQRTDFDFEIVIGDDCSTDRTREIVIALQREYPDRIRLLLPERNQGSLGKVNFVQTLGACRGEYVAILEGDDYWTSGDKLQRQVDVLDERPDCVVCFHNVEMRFERATRHVPSRMCCSANQKIVSTIEDILKINFIPFCSTMFRRGLVHDLPTWFFQLAMGDWPLHVLNAQHGKIAYIPENMATYRIHSGGMWSTKSQVSNIEEFLKFYDYLDPHLGFRYTKQISQARKVWTYQLALAYETENQLLQARAHLLKTVFQRPFDNSVKPTRLLKMFLRLYAPSFSNFVRIFSSGKRALLRSTNIRSLIE